jgi:hypothetical protein
MPSDDESKSEFSNGCSPKVLNTLAIFTGIFVFVVAAYIFLPMVLQPNREPGRIVCLSNLKQAGLGMLIYSSDFDDRLPPASEWMDTIKPDVKIESIFHCNKVSPGEYGYAFNPQVAGSRPDAKAETTPLIYDSAAKGRSAVAPFDSLPNPPRHGTVNYVACADGHAKASRIGAGVR